MLTTLVVLILVYTYPDISERDMCHVSSRHHISDSSSHEHHRTEILSKMTSVHHMLEQTKHIAQKTEEITEEIPFIVWKTKQQETTAPRLLGTRFTQGINKLSGTETFVHTNSGTTESQSIINQNSNSKTAKQSKSKTDKLHEDRHRPRNDKNTKSGIYHVESRNVSVSTRLGANIGTNKGGVDKAASVMTCDSDCVRFRLLLDSWPDDRPRAAFYYLTQTKRLASLNASLASIDAHFNNRFHYPVIVFHEDDLIPYLDDIRRMTRSDLFFQRITFTTPEFLQRPIPRRISCTSSVSYRHMCRFHAKVVYELPIMKKLQYYWRLDDDSMLLSDVTYDVFRYMEHNALQYGYLWRHWDSYSCVQGLWEHTEQYIQEHNITTQFFQSWTKAWLYYNNFEISSTKMWFSSEYQAYIDYIDMIGGMFYYRWGDAPIHGIAVSMFISKNQTHLFHDIGYRHGSYTHQAKPDITT